jgi:choline kinase
MKTIILAAGEGTRLRPYTLDRPKCLVEVEGVTLLDRQLTVLRKANIDPIILIGGYKSELLVKPGVELRVNPRYFETNMVWTLFCAEEDFGDGFILSYGDIVYSKAILQELLQSEADISVTIDLDWEKYWRARNENPLDDAETLKMKENGEITEIGQKPKSLSEIEGQYMGLIKFSALGVTTLKKIFHDSKNAGSLRGKSLEKAFMTDLLQAIIDAGHKVQSVPVYAGWVEVDTVEDLNSQVLRERIKSMDI